MIEDRNHFTPKMDKFLKQICPSLLLWELLLFQGIPIKSEVCIIKFFLKWLIVSIKLFLVLEKLESI